jgi:hypothetical protein
LDAHRNRIDEWGLWVAPLEARLPLNSTHLRMEIEGPLTLRDRHVVAFPRSGQDIARLRR